MRKTDCLTPYLRYALAFIGINDVHFPRCRNWAAVRKQSNGMNEARQQLSAQLTLNITGVSLRSLEKRLFFDGALFEMIGDINSKIQPTKYPERQHNTAYGVKKEIHHYLASDFLS